MDDIKEEMEDANHEVKTGKGYSIINCRGIRRQFIYAPTIGTILFGLSLVNS